MGPYETNADMSLSLVDIMGSEAGAGMGFNCGGGASDAPILVSVFMGLFWDLIEVIDPLGVFNVDISGEMAIGDPWEDPPIGPGGKVEVGVSWRQGTATSLQSSLLILEA